jgi:O-antigen/teichoic acid export membrane protein
MSSAPTKPASVMAPAIRGSVWTLGGYAIGQLLRLGSNLVLTRLLFPEVFGQMALVFIFIQGLQMFSDVGTGPAIIQNARGDEESFLRTAWTIQSGRGVALWLASWVVAWPAAEFYGQPVLRWLVPTAALTAVFGGLESTAMHVEQRHLRFGRLTILELGTQLLGIVVNVVLAYVDRRLYGPGDPDAVWAIIAGSLVSSAARLVLSHTYLPGIRHRFHLDRAAMRQLFHFGRWIFVSTVLTFFAAQSDRLVFGRMIPIALFGVYSVASTLSALPTQAVLKLGGAVVFPAYSRLVGSPGFAGVFWRVRRPVLLGGAAIVGALVACGPFLVQILYDRRYAEAGWILQYLSAAAWFQVLECTIGAALLAKGRAEWVSAGSAAKVAGLLVAIPAGYHLAGFQGALAGLVVSEALKYFVSSVGAARNGLGWLGRDWALSAAIGGTSVLGVAAGHLVAGRWASPAASLVVSGVVGGGLWAALGALHVQRELVQRGGDAVSASPSA